MLNIMKYEFIRKYRMVFIALTISIILNLGLGLLYGFIGIGVFLGLFPFAMIILYTVDIIKMYSDDLNRKTGYMLFMTPHSGYQIVITKVLVGLLVGLFLALTYFIFLMVNSLIMYINVSMHYGYVISYNLSNLFYNLNMFLSGNFGFNLGHVFVLLLALLLSAMTFIITAYTSITIRKSIFSEIKFGWLFSFIIFIGLNMGISYLSSFLVPTIVVNNSHFMNNSISALSLLKTMSPALIFSAILCALLTLISGYLLEHKINL